MLSQLARRARASSAGDKALSVMTAMPQTTSPTSRLGRERVASGGEQPLRHVTRGGGKQWQARELMGPGPPDPTLLALLVLGSRRAGSSGGGGATRPSRVVLTVRLHLLPHRLITRRRNCLNSLGSLAHDRHTSKPALNTRQTSLRSRLATARLPTPTRTPQRQGNHDGDKEQHGVHRYPVGYGLVRSPPSLFLVHRSRRRRLFQCHPASSLRSARDSPLTPVPSTPSPR